MNRQRSRAFAVTSGLGSQDKIVEFKKANDDYNAILLESIADRLAEAFAERMHQRVRKELWGFQPDEQLDNAHLMRMAGRFSRRVRGFAKAHQIPVIDCRRGERKHDLAEEYLATHTVKLGLFLILFGRADGIAVLLQASRQPFLCLRSLIERILRTVQCLTSRCRGRLRCP